MPLSYLSAIGLILSFLFALPSCGSSSACDDGEEVFNGQCVRICPEGYTRGADGTCYPGGSGGVASGNIDWSSNEDYAAAQCNAWEECQGKEECIILDQQSGTGFCLVPCEVKMENNCLCIDHANVGEEPAGRCWGSSTIACETGKVTCEGDRVCTTMIDDNYCLDTCDPIPNSCPNDGELCLPYVDENREFKGVCFDLPML